MNSKRRLQISRWQLGLSAECPRCFWLLKAHQVKQPQGYPLSLNNVMDALLKAEFDLYRKRQELPPIFRDQPALNGTQLFSDFQKLGEWRDNWRGLRWTDPVTEHVLYGAIDDILTFPDGSLAVLDYKSTGSSGAVVYPSYQLQMDTYTFLLQQLGFKTYPKAFLAFFIATRDAGFDGRLPFRGTLVEVSAQPERVPDLFRRAVALTMEAEAPPPGENCSVCRWHREAGPIFSEEALSHMRSQLDSSALP